jgi:hypothetical protein
MSEWFCVFMHLFVKQSGTKKRAWHMSDLSSFYVQFVTSWSFLHIPVTPCLKHFKTPGSLISPVSYPSLIRSELYDCWPEEFAKFPGMHERTLCSLEKVIGSQTEQNESHRVYVHISQLILWRELLHQFITVSNWLQCPKSLWLWFLGSPE